MKSGIRVWVSAAVLALVCLACRSGYAVTPPGPTTSGSQPQPAQQPATKASDSTTSSGPSAAVDNKNTVMGMATAQQSVVAAAPAAAQSSQTVASAPAQQPAPVARDTNGDGKVDTWETVVVKDGKTTREVAVDSNKDGKPDQWFVQGADGRVFQMNLDTDFDGKIDEWDLYNDPTNVHPSSKAFDMDFDGDVDMSVFDYNQDGTIDAYDTDGNGLPDKGPESLPTGTAPPTA